MTLFTPDLYRNFAIGFAAGAVIVGIATIGELSDEISPPAQASETLAAPQPSDQFWTLSE